MSVHICISCVIVQVTVTIAQFRESATEIEMTIEVVLKECYNPRNRMCAEMHSALEREVGYMKEFMKQIRMDLITSSIICIIFGIVLIARPIETVSLFCRVLAIIMIVVGGMFMFSYFLNWMSSGLSAAMGLIVLLIGVWIFITPGIIETLIPVVIGVILLCHGIQDVRMSWQMKEYGQDSWKFSMVLATISVIFGVLCIIDAFMVVKAAMILLGVALIYNGLSNLLITTRTTKAEKEYRNKMDPVDVEFKDED